ncbi:MAG: hypothetical protein IJH50_11585 [Kiritimatiellae bacterium]|nr:hypothetical protein [Kiritimatiellia bacterium]
MKKPLIVASVVCACAFAANASFDSWFTGINSGATTANNLNASSGTWTFDTTHGDFEVNGNVLEFDLDDTYAVTYDVDVSKAPDTNTVTKVTVSGVFTPVKLADLPLEGTMNDRLAQVGFVICDTGSGNSYYAWVGGANWFALSATGATPDPTATTTLIVEFDYSRRLGDHTKNYVKFFIQNGELLYALEDSNHVTSFTMTSDQGAALRQVAGISCYGSGSLSAANGNVEIGVAEVNGIKYASLADANTAAAGSGTILVDRPTTETVTLSSGVTISDPGKNASGATLTLPANATVTVIATADEANNGVSGNCSVPLNFSAGAGATVDITLPGTIATTKEVVPGSVNVSGTTATYSIQTLASILTAANPGGNKALSANVSKLRTFIAADEALAEVDAAADVTTASIQTALQANGGNGIPKWESYVLGIAPTASVKPVPAPAGDADTTAITLAIPAITGDFSGDYGVTYKVGNGAAQNDPSAIKVPLATGTSDISIVLTPTVQ